jgi:hypothetical protein
VSVRYGDDVVTPGLPEDADGGVDGFTEEFEYEGPPFGPYDAEYLDPEMTEAVGRMDFGAVQVPVPMTGTVNLEKATKGKLQAVHVTMPGGRLSVSALAAPRSSGLWSQLASEIEQSLRDGGAQVRSFQGEWGRELHARTDGARSVFVGVDGERWMLYGVATGPAEHAVTLDDELRRMLRATVVVRGRQPYPPRTVLPLSTPESLDPASQQPADARPQRATMTLRTKAAGPAAADTADGPSADETAVSPVEGTGRRAAVTGRPQRRPAPAQPQAAQPQGAQQSQNAQQQPQWPQAPQGPQQPRRVPPGAGVPQPGPAQPGRGQRPAPVAPRTEQIPGTSRPAAAQGPGQGQQRSGGFPPPARAEESGFTANRSGWSSRGAEPVAESPEAGAPERPVERSAATRRAEQANIDTGFMPPVAGGRRRARQAEDTGSRTRGSATGQHRAAGRSAARQQPAQDRNEMTQQIGYDDWYGGGDNPALPVRRAEPPAPDETTRISPEPIGAERAPAPERAPSPGRRARTEDVRGARPALEQPGGRRSRDAQAPAARNGADIEGPATNRPRPGEDTAPAGPQAPAAYGQQATPGQGTYGPATHDGSAGGRDAYRADQRETRQPAPPLNGRRPSRNDGPTSPQIRPVAAEQPEPARPERPGRPEPGPREQPRQQDGRWPVGSGVPRTNGSASPAREPEQGMSLAAAFYADPLGAAAIPAERLAAMEQEASERAAAQQSSPAREDERNGYAARNNGYAARSEAGGRSDRSRPRPADDAGAAVRNGYPSNGYTADLSSSGAYAAYGESPSGSYASYDESYSARYGNPRGSAPDTHPADPWAEDPRGDVSARNGRAANGADHDGSGRRARNGADHAETGRRGRNGVASDEALDPMELIARIREQNGGGSTRSRGRHRAPGE